jgi:TetR/AcrR family transcriptional repressor of nem operon
VVRVSREQFAENRQRILDAAGRLFREKGFDGIGVDGIMKEAGLTHGGFYGHFASKSDLAEKACAAALEKSIDKWEALAGGPSEAGLAEIAKSYLSAAHRDRRGTGCLVAALGGEVARQSDSVRAAVTKGLRAQLGILQEMAAGATDGDRRQRAIATLSGFVGAMILARIVDDPAFSDEILAAAAMAFGGDADQESGTADRA